MWCMYICMYVDRNIHTAYIREEEETGSLHWLLSALFPMESLTESGACQFGTRLVARKPQQSPYVCHFTLVLGVVAGPSCHNKVCPWLLGCLCSHLSHTYHCIPTALGHRYSDRQLYGSQGRQCLLITEKRKQRGNWGDVRISPCPLRTWEGLLTDLPSRSFKGRKSEGREPITHDRQWENPVGFEEWGLPIPSLPCEEPIFIR